MKKFLIILSFFFIYKKAFTWCSEPYIPNPPSTLYKPTKPSTPYCINEVMKTHTCDEWEINNYYNQIDSYNSEVRDYIFELELYLSNIKRLYNDAIKYVECEVESFQ